MAPVLVRLNATQAGQQLSPSPSWELLAFLGCPQVRPPSDSGLASRLGQASIPPGGPLSPGRLAHPRRLFSSGLTPDPPPLLGPQAEPPPLPGQRRRRRRPGRAPLAAAALGAGSPARLPPLGDPVAPRPAEAALRAGQGRGEGRRGEGPSRPAGCRLSRPPLPPPSPRGRCSRRRRRRRRGGRRGRHVGHVGGRQVPAPCGERGGGRVGRSQALGSWGGLRSHRDSSRERGPAGLKKESCGLVWSVLEVIES